jgi:hypothetical protein
MRRRGVIAGFVATVVVGATALVGPASAGAATCATGTWRLQDVSLSRTIKSPYGNLTVTPLAGGAIRVSVGAAGTWSVTVNKSFRATGSLPVGTVNGTATLTGAATGTYKTKKSGAVVFRLTSGSGTAAFSGTLNGVPLNFTYPVKAGDVQKYLGIKGKALPSCSGNSLTLRFKLVTLSFARV